MQNAQAKQTFFVQISIAIASALLAFNATAQVYKCTIVDKNSHKNKVVYTDAPCNGCAKQSLTSIQANSQNQSKKQTKSLFDDNTIQAESNAQLDNAVNQAVLNKNFAYAKSIAQTKEHWRLIAISEKVAEPVTENLNNQTANNGNCGKASDEYEAATRLNWRDNSMIAIKKSMMFAACGVPEIQQAPQQIQPVLITQLDYNGGYYHGYQTGGISIGQWYPPPIVRPHSFGQGHQHWQQGLHSEHNGYNKPYHQNRPNHFDANSTQTGGNVNLNITGKRFGVQASSFGQQNSRQYRQNQQTLNQP